ncbi:hypothetical protein AAVH_25024 [Aphelenchoides avenae]|nr:hypothetical protein AAVH_25024 [Aphelenchus avenae]
MKVGDRARERGESKLQRRRICSKSPPSRSPAKSLPGACEEKNVTEKNVSDDADEIEVIRVVKAPKSGPNSNKASKGNTKKSSSSEYRKQAEKLKAEEDRRRAEKERDRARNERDDAQDKCKALQKKIHDLEEHNRNCEAIRQVTAAAADASIEQERDDAAKKLLEGEKRIEALKKAASDAVRLTFEFQAWRIRAVIKAKKNGTSQKQSNNDREDGAAFPETVATAVQKVAKIEAEEASTDNARKRPSASSAPVGKRRRIDSVKPTAEVLSQKLDAVLAGYSESVSEKYKLFFVENLRGSVTIEELVQFVRVRCPSDVDLADNVLESFTTSP